MKRAQRGILLSCILATGAFVVLSLVGAAGDTDDLKAQLTAVLPAEREYCEQVLGNIFTTSNERDVAGLLGKTPSSREHIERIIWRNVLKAEPDRVKIRADLLCPPHVIIRSEESSCNVLSARNLLSTLESASLQCLNSWCAV